MATKYSKWPQNIANGRKIYQVAIKHIKWPQNIPKWPQNKPIGSKIDKHRPLQDSRIFTQIGIFWF
jgi:hypothetical protein